MPLNTAQRLDLVESLPHISVDDRNRFNKIQANKSTDGRVSLELSNEFANVLTLRAGIRASIVNGLNEPLPVNGFFNARDFESVKVQAQNFEVDVQNPARVEVAAVTGSRILKTKLEQFHALLDAAEASLGVGKVN